MATFLVTGAGGFIGSSLVPLLVDAGHHVKAVDTFWFGEGLLPKHQSVALINADVRHIDDSLFDDVDVVVDLAALSNDPCGEAFKTETWEINHKARINTATLAKQAGVKRYILASSCSVYGFSEQLLDECSAVSPLTTYAEANVAAENDTLALATDDFSVTALRMATLFGYAPRMRLDLVVNSMCYSAWRYNEITIAGGGTQERPLLYVKDAAQAMLTVAATSVDKVHGQIFNVGNNSLNYTINEIAARVSSEVENITSRDPILRHCGPQDLRSYNVSFDKLVSTIGWQPETGFGAEIASIINFLDNADEAALAKCYTLDWYKKKIFAR